MFIIFPDQTLKAGTISCPCCKQPMLFHQIAGLLLLKRERKDDHVMVYDAICRNTHKQYEVRV
jgi:hypothetical protein